MVSSKPGSSPKKARKVSAKTIKARKVKATKALKCGVCFKAIGKTAVKSLLESGYMYHAECIRKQDKKPMQIYCPQARAYVSNFYPSSKCAASLSAFYEDYAEGVEGCKSGCHGKC